MVMKLFMCEYCSRNYFLEEEAEECENKCYPNGPFKIGDILRIQLLKYPEGGKSDIRAIVCRIRLNENHIMVPSLVITLPMMHCLKEGDTTVDGWKMEVTNFVRVATDDTAKEELKEHIKSIESHIHNTDRDMYEAARKLEVLRYMLLGQEIEALRFALRVTNLTYNPKKDAWRE